MMDLLHGYPDVDAFDPLLTVDHVRLLNLLRYYTDHATVVEEMLVALLHMQIDVCHFRQGRKKRYEGLARFRKNIIAFPQELQEVKQMFHFLTNLNIGDLVNVALPDKDRGEVIFVRGLRISQMTASRSALLLNRSLGKSALFKFVNAFAYLGALSI